jgi:hypothetical protein
VNGAGTADEPSDARSAKSWFAAARPTRTPSSVGGPGGRGAGLGGGGFGPPNPRGDTPTPPGAAPGARSEGDRGDRQPFGVSHTR